MEMSARPKILAGQYFRYVESVPIDLKSLISYKKGTIYYINYHVSNLSEKYFEAIL